MNCEKEAMNIKDSICTKDIINVRKTETEMIDGGEYVEEVPVPSIEYTIEDNYTLCADGIMMSDGDDVEYDRIKKANEDSINGVSCYEQAECKNYAEEANEENMLFSIENAVAVASINKKNDNVCNLCDKNFKSNSLLKQHLKKHPKMRICSYCSYTNYYINNVYDHINTVHKEHRRPYPCTYCTYETFYSEHLKKHIKQKHTRKTKSVHNCPHCTYITNFRTSLRNHIKDEHTKLIIYQCVTCEFKAITKNAINKHMKDKHTNVCPFCDFASSNKLLLGNHVNSLHANYFYFTCPHCSYKTYYKKSLQEHMGDEHKDNINDIVAAGR